MSHIQKRKLKTGTSWRVRYVDPDGRERSKSFKRKADAEDFATEVSHNIKAGSYIDPAAGRITVQRYLQQWLAQQVHLRPSTRASYTTRFRTMVYPHLGHLPIGRVRPSTLRSWQARLLQDYAPSTIASTRGPLSAAFAAAVHDRLIPASPFVGVKAPQLEREQIVPLTIGQVRAGETALRSSRSTRRYAAIIPTAAGTGMRASELWGLTLDRVDFLRRTAKVDRQLAGRRKSEPVFGPPKTHASYRTIPLPDTVIEALNTHLRAYPCQRDELIFRTGRGTPITRTVWSRAWAPAAAAMGLDPGEGLHELRHFYASLLIAKGRNVKEVQERLGHASAQETLDTYSHLFPDSDDGTRAAIDAAFGDDESGGTPKDAAAGDQ